MSKIGEQSLNAFQWPCNSGASAWTFIQGLTFKTLTCTKLHPPLYLPVYYFLQSCSNLKRNVLYIHETNFHKCKIEEISAITIYSNLKKSRSYDFYVFPLGKELYEATFTSRQHNLFFAISCLAFYQKMFWKSILVPKHDIHKLLNALGFPKVLKCFIQVEVLYFVWQWSLNLSKI